VTLAAVIAARVSAQELLKQLASPPGEWLKSSKESSKDWLQLYQKEH
jgi:hypothetical protein